ncbi:MAG: cytochrome c3 family protein [Chloroflexota bacterium]|nr:cytochrome c3 family protein [Chloroflexota bacterium]
MKGKAKLLVGVAAAVVLVLSFGVPAMADNDLHNASMLTEADACAGCHRAHTAQAGKLLKAGDTQDQFCFSCHDGTGAYTNVVDGVLEGNSTFGVGDDSDGNPLKGGGFTYAMMDINHDGSVVSGGVTSVHSADGVGSSDDTIWGSGPINSSEEDYGVTVDLACGDCHNPHGNGNYRILRGNPNGMENEGSLAAVDVADQDPIVYEITHTANGYRDMSDYSAPTSNAIGEWCSQCHTRYWASGGSGHTDSTDMVFAYRHMTNGLNGSCLACHVAHGTSATMGTYSGAVTYPDGTTQGATPADESRLLSGNNRSVCTDPDSCHGDQGTWDLFTD